MQTVERSMSVLNVEKNSPPREFWPASVKQAINNVHISFSFLPERRKIKLFFSLPASVDRKKADALCQANIGPAPELEI